MPPRHVVLRGMLSLLLTALLAACTSGVTAAPVPPATTRARPTAVVRPPDRGPGFAPALAGVVAPTCTNARTGWLATEQLRRAGVTDLPPTVAAVDASRATGVQLYLDRSYAACGERIGLHLSAPRRLSVVVEAMRVGAYGDHDARTVWSSAPLVVDRQPPRPAVAHRTQDNAWPVALELRPTSSWAPGLYVLAVRPALGAGARLPMAYQSLVVLTSGAPAGYLAVESDLTQLAYDEAGGSSLYLGEGATQQTRVAARRWVASAHRGLVGSGLAQLLSKDVPLAVVLGRDGLTADWTTDTSVDADPAQLRGRTSLLLPGHSEYWTRRGYDALDAAVHGGSNLAVLGANEIYWQARVVRDRSGAVTAMVVYREPSLDPVRDRAETTSQWRAAPLNRDPAALTGLGKGGVHITGAATVVTASSPLLAHTGLRRGDVLPQVYGNEGDTLADPNVPHGEVVLLRSVARTASGAAAPVATVVHADPSGAGVFDAGTTEWLCAITGQCADGPRSPAVRRALATITLDLLRLLAHPRAGRALTA